jgi:hypothetical protein
MPLKRSLVSLLALCALLPSTAAADAPLALSEGVEHVRQIPVPGTVGANFKDGYMYVTGQGFDGKADPGLVGPTGGASGYLSVYDIGDADDPKLVSHTQIPHYQNEDVSIGGNRLLISGDGYFGGSLLVVVDISNPAAPRIEQIVNMQLLGEGHTATCIQDCKYAWVAGDRHIAVLNLDEVAQFPGTGPVPDVQVQKAASKVEVGDLWADAEGNPTIHEFGWSTHDVQVDEAGIAWVAGGNGTIGFDTSPGAYPVPDKSGDAALLEPRIVARTGPDATADSDFSTIPMGAEDRGDTVNDFIHHNSLRPDAAAFQPREPGDDGTDVRPGEVVLIGEEDIWSRPTGATTKGGCETQGSFQTWQVTGYGETGADQATVKNLDTWTTEFNELIQNDEDPLAGEDIVPTNGFCSAHYFDEHDGLVATAWYEQGTRLLDISDPRDIKQVGYFLAPDSIVWAAYFAPTDPSVIYVADHSRGIDVLRVGEGDAGGPPPTAGKGKKGKGKGRGPSSSKASSERAGEVEAPLADWWFERTKRATAVEHPRFGWVCRVK